MYSDEKNMALILLNHLAMFTKKRSNVITTVRSHVANDLSNIQIDSRGVEKLLAARARRDT